MPVYIPRCGGIRGGNLGGYKRVGRGRCSSKVVVFSAPVRNVVLVKKNAMRVRHEISARYMSTRSLESNAYSHSLSSMQYYLA